MQFASDIQQWSTVDEFRTHLQKHDPTVCSWVKFIVIHHTWKPTQRDWRGLQSMESLRRYYMSKGWSAGPHLFVCHGAPNPTHDGIFQLTPLNMIGVHAGSCNSRSIGIEVVGDFDAEAWSAQLTDLVCLTMIQFMNWRKLASYSVIGHRNCGSQKTCPGEKIFLPDVRKRIIDLRGE